MGCVLAKESSHVVAFGSKREEKNPRGESGRKEGGSAAKVEESSRNRDVEEVREGGETVKGEEEAEEKVEESDHHKPSRESRQRSRQNANPRIQNVPKQSRAEQVAAGWPSWLTEICGEALRGWVPRRANTFEKIDKIGQGTYSNVYRAKDLWTGKIVALKKVRFDNMERESVRFMAREIHILRHLDHPNVVKLQGLVTSRMSCSLYLVFEYMVHDLAGLAATPEIKFTESQVKCYMHQLLSGLDYCHNSQVLHRDVKGSNLLIDDEGVLKIADFGLASFFDPERKQKMTSRVVTLWYRPPELLLGATEYGVGIDLWSAGCILAELLAGKPIMPGHNEIEQLHKIYKLCGSPSDEYWKKLHNPTIIKPREPYRRCIRETFKDFPPSSFPLIETLLAIDPAERGTATDALQSEFFRNEPLACDPSSLPKYPPTKEMDARKRDDEARRSRAANKAEGEGVKKKHFHNRRVRAYPAPEANAELPLNIDRRRMISHGNAKSKSEKFPPPHEDGAVGFPLGASHRIDPSAVPRDIPFSSTSLTYSKDLTQNWSGPLVDPSSSWRKKHASGKPREPSKVIW
ncbi:hypothetical protein SAY87_009232 [Trapa incisa]|uniref:Protein kinase domain-containing protein n=1 Tax=Trapa incisa TaxID=236973 RepID=A0AAN7JUQ1_9MYRT|nr:hypothetical protein SAY87_009232 [Trapa incisa]